MNKSLATCIDININEQMTYLTDFDANINNYQAGKIVEISAKERNSNFLKDNMEISLLYGQDSFSKDAILNNALNDAFLIVFCVDIENQENRIDLGAYEIDKIIIMDDYFTLQLKGRSFGLNRDWLCTYSQTCRASFGDKSCGLDLTQMETSSCDKTLNSCIKFNNVANFRGEPFVPNIAKVLSGE